MPVQRPARALEGARRPWRCLALPLLVLATPARSLPPGAPELPTDPVLAKLIEQSLATRPELARAAAAARAERQRASQVGALPDPMLELGVQNDGFTSWEIGEMETSWYSIMASQTFPWPGKLRLRREIVELGAAQADQDLARLRLSTEAEVRRAYLSLMLARDRLALVDRLEAVATRAAAVARARYEAGTAAQSDVLRAQLEIKRVRLRRWALRVEASTALQALNRLRSHPIDERIDPAVHVADLPVPALRSSDDAYGDALSRSPELRSARLGVTQGQRSSDLARKSYFPDITLNLGIMPRGSLPVMWLVTVGIPLPIYAGAKQSEAVAESRSRLAASEADFGALEQVLHLRVEQRRTALESALESIRIYREGLLAQSEATAESTLAQYEVGKVTFVSVLEANAGLIADQDGFLQVLAQAQRLEIDALEVSLESIGLPEAGMAARPAGGGAMPAGTQPTGSGMPGPAETGGDAGAGM